MTASEDGPSPELTTNRKGAIAEAEIACAAIRSGVEVYRPMQEHGRYDLIFGIGDLLLRVQCKWASRQGDVVRIALRTSRFSPRGYIQTKYGSDEIDAVAAYCGDLDECYLLPISLVASRNMICLRLAPTRNGQSLRLNWAEQYRFLGL